jgi:5-methylcytosine-specific restriction protein A
VVFGQRTKSYENEGMMPHTPCLEAGCPNIATSRGRCDEHRRELERERSRRRRAERGPRIHGTKKWQTTRLRKLAKNPICEACDKELAVEVDHIVPLNRGGDPYAFENLSSLCSPCHWAKTARENRESPRGRV